jgi:molecular chaperone DnaJ
VVRNSVQRVVPIPAGVDEGTQVRLAGEGEPGGNGGPHGNLYIVVHVRPHRFFRRRGDDVLLDVGVNVAQATLGAHISVPSIDGEESIQIPAGSQPGKVIRLKGKGIPHLQRGGRGDQLVVISIDIPRTLSPEQRELFERLGSTMGDGAIPQERGFLERLKELLGGAAE